MLKKGNQTGYNRHQLLWRDVHVGDLVGLNLVKAHRGSDAQHIVSSNILMLIKRRRSLSNYTTLFLVCCHVFNLVCHHTITNNTIRSFDETKFVNLCKGRQRCNQTNVWSFRSFNRTNTSIVARVNVTHLKASTVTVQTAGPK